MKRDLRTATTRDERASDVTNDHYPREGNANEAVKDPAAPVSRKHERLYKSLTIQAWRVAVLIVVVCLWQFVSDRKYIDPFMISSPLAILRFLGSAFTSATFWIDFRATVTASLIAFIVGSVGGIVTGLILSLSNGLNAVVDPYLTVLNAMPRVALAPLFLLWFGLGQTSKVVMGISTIYFILVLNTYGGVKSTDHDLKSMFAVMDASRLHTFTKLILPSAVPAIFAGLRLAVVYSLLGVVLSEMLASRQGLGRQLTYYAGVFQVQGVFGILMVLSATAVIGNSIIGYIEKWILRWQ